MATRNGYRKKLEKARGHRVATYSIGSGDTAVLLLNGGPGLPCGYLGDPHAVLAGHAAERA